MLPARELRKTGVQTSAIGFGCAGLFRLPNRKARMIMLDAAYDAGIRHFDTAPMYGLGLSEAELGSFLKRHRQDVTVTTKFGIDPTVLTRTLAPLQKPARRFLAKRPAINEGIKTAGEGPRSGMIGRFLYSAPGYNSRTARKSLEHSLRALGTDYIDVFLMHDPVGDLVVNPSGLADYLDEQCKIGLIRCWGVTEPDTLHRPDLIESLGWPAVIQHRDDVFDVGREPPVAARITYGALSRAVPAFREFLGRSPAECARWCELVGMNLKREGAVPQLLLAVALQRNSAGPVLFTTTRPEHTAVAASAASGYVAEATQLAAFSELAATVRAAYPQLAGKT